MTLYHDPIKVTGARISVTRAELTEACKRVWGPHAYVTFTLQMLLYHLGIEVK